MIKDINNQNKNKGKEIVISFLLRVPTDSGLRLTKSLNQVQFFLIKLYTFFYFTVAYHSIMVNTNHNQ